MSDLSAFPITRKWPARHPDRLQLYSLPTPNGVKVSIMLEEVGLAYEPHLVSFAHATVTSPNPRGCSACSTGNFGIELGSWATNSALRTWPFFPGFAT